MPGIDSYTKLLLHCNGTDGSTTFTDESASGHTLTAIGNAQIDTAQSKFGGASGLFDGTGDYLSIPDNSDWDFGNGDFTIDCWIRFNALPGDWPSSFAIYDQFYTSRCIAWYITSTDLRVAWSSSGSGVDDDVGRTWTPSTGVWYHLALVRYGTVLKMFVDGTQLGTDISIGTTTLYNSYVTPFIAASHTSDSSADGELNGWIDEFRISKGIARWTSNFTPSSSEYDDSEEQIISDTIKLEDSWELLTNPEQQSISDTVVLDDDWNIFTNPELAYLDDTVELDDTWELLTNPDTVEISDTTTLADSWGLSFIYRIPLNLDLRWLASIARVINTSLSWLIAKKISTDFRWLGLNRKTIATDFRWLALPYTTLPLTPISPANIQIFINGTDVLLGNDVDLQTGNILHTAGQMSQASFVLARRHDDLNRTHTGATSQITNQNPVQIYIAGHLEFDGYVMTINVDSERETVAIVAQMEEPASNRHAVELPLPSVNEPLHIYHCLVNNVSVDNPKEDTRAVIIGSHGRYWNGSSWVFYIEDALVFTTDIDAQAYIDSYTDSTVNQVFFSKSPSVTSRQKNPQYYKGVKVDLGTEIRQQVDRYRQLELIFSGKGVYAQQIEDGTFLTKSNYTYFWAVKATNVRTGFYNGDFRYIGTSLASTTTDLFVLNGVTPMRQRIKDDIETELGYYYIGSAPYKEISTKNGILIPTDKWQDRTDGLYNVLEEGYNYTNYAKRVAELEYEKLKNIDGNILPITSANIDITFDAYYFYNIKLLTRINITNTTVANTYKNTNGFPTSVKSININFSTMKITLNTSNKLSQEELDEIDQQMPDDESSEYITPERANRIYRKFDLKSWLFVS